MIRRTLNLGLFLVALWALWSATPEAQAQRRGGRGGGVGVYIGPGGVGVDYGRGGYYNGGYRGGYYDGYRSGYYRDGNWSGNRWIDRYPMYYERDYVVPSTQISEAYYQDPSPPDNARVRVLVPDASAEVFFNGTATQQRGAERVFDTPSLRNGNTHYYEIKARWRDANGQMIERTQTINVQRGRESVADFTQARPDERIPAAPNPGDANRPVP